MPVFADAVVHASMHDACDGLVFIYALQLWAQMQIHSVACFCILLCTLASCDKVQRWAGLTSRLLLMHASLLDDVSCDHCCLWMRSQTIPWWVRWIWYSNPITWGLYGIIITQMGDLDSSIELTDDQSQTISSYLEQQYNYKYSFRWPVVGILLGFTAAALFGAVASLRFFNFERR